MWCGNGAISTQNKNSHFQLFIIKFLVSVSDWKLCSQTSKHFWRIRGFSTNSLCLCGFLQCNVHMNTRTIKPTFIPTQARTQRLLKSPIPYLTQLLNNDSSKLNDWYVSYNYFILVWILWPVDNCIRCLWPNQWH